MTLLLDLADAARKSGLKVIELPGWKDNYSPGGFHPNGSLDHHTGSYDGIADAADDLSYAKWLAFTGRSDLPPPLCNLALSAECVVYVCSSGNANHAGEAKATGPMPHASDGNVLYIGTEAMNSGSQGWGSKGVDAHGQPVTQGEALARLDAALALHYGWPASHVRGHKETSVTGKWDPGLLDMDSHRAKVADYMKGPDVKTKVMSSNLLFKLSAEQFEAALRKVLADDPDTCSLQEVLKANHRDGILNRVCKELGYAWARAKGGEPVLWKISRYGKDARWVRPVLLARAEFVGHLPGRKDRLPASIATEVGLNDLLTGKVVVVIDYHMTAEVQDVQGGNTYKKELKYRLRVLRHKREKRRLGRRGRAHLKNGRVVRLTGDGNFSGMQIGGFKNCWTGHAGPPHGTLQGRPVDIIFDVDQSDALKTIKTASDHDTLVCNYSEGRE
jgi:hypothetical protein